MNIVIAEVSLNKDKRLPYSLTAIKGIGLSRAKVICQSVFLDENKFLTTIRKRAKLVIIDE